MQTQSFSKEIFNNPFKNKQTQTNQMWIKKRSNATSRLSGKKRRHFTALTFLKKNAFLLVMNFRYAF